MTGSSVRIIDCTFRDGGFYTDWHFEPSLVAAYFDAVHTGGVRDVEIGYRFPESAKISGPFAHSTDEFVSSLNIHSDIRVGVMINASDFMVGGRPDAEAVGRAFSSAAASPICFVRIAARIDEVAVAAELCSVLTGLGYRTHLNLMRMSALRINSGGWEVLDKAEIEAFGDITFADSFGEILPADISPIIQRMRSLTDAVLGVHMHDSMGLALANTIASIEAGVDSVDATVAGIGRGSGNTKTEAIGGLLPMIMRNGNGKGLDTNRLNILSCEFEALQALYRWGPNVYYSVGALSGIHPTYIQFLCDGRLVDGKRILAALLFLGEAEAAVFSTDRLQQALDYAAGRHV